MKKILFVLMFAFICMNANAQIPSWQWAKEGICSPNGIGDETNMVSDDSGNVYITGVFVDTLSFDIYSLISNNYTGINNEIFTVKYNSSGNVVWAKSSADTVTAIPYGIATDPFGDVYISGYFASPTITFGSYTLVNDSFPNFDIFIVKYDPVGNVIWAQGIGASGNEEVRGITTDASGNIYLTGGFDSPFLTFGTNTISNTGAADIFLAKYDQMGNAIWAKDFGGTGIEESFCITKDAFGDIFFGGTFESSVAYFGSDSIISYGSDFFLTKCDSAGNVLWVRSAKGLSNDFCYSLSTDAQGNIFATGVFTSPSIIFGLDTLINGVNNDVFIVKYDSSGNVLWAKNSVGTGQGYSIISDSSGNTYISGSFANSTIAFDTITLQAPSGYYDPMFMVKYDSSGHILYAFAFGSGGDDYSNVAFGPSGSVYLAGDFYVVNPFVIGNDSLNLTGIETPFIAKLGYIGEGIPEIKFQQFITLYPNPTSGTFTLKGDLRFMNYDLRITNVLGQEVYTQPIINQQSSIINLPQLSNGVYFYSLSPALPNNSGLISNGEGDVLRGKFVKE